jgi:transcriptional regulator with XRE-family HTH domain
MKKAQRNFKGTEDLVMDLLGKREGAKMVAGMRAHRAATATISRLVLNRVKQGLTQREVARRMGVSPSKVCRMEDSVDADLSYADIQKYSDALGLSANVVFEVKNAPHDVSSFVYSIGTQLEQLKGLLPASSKFDEKLTNVYGSVLFPLLLSSPDRHVPVSGIPCG